LAGGNSEVENRSPLPPEAAPADKSNEESSAIRAQESARGECAERGKSAGQQMTHWDRQNSDCGGFGNFRFWTRHALGLMGVGRPAGCDFFFTPILILDLHPLLLRWAGPGENE
jgi:hypothetical protein